MKPNRQSNPPTAPPITIRVSEGDAPARTHRFTGSFQIGRDETCGVCILNDYVSRNHAEVAWRDGSWWLKDLGSANGVFVDGRRTEKIPVADQLKARLGVRGPFVQFEIAPAVGELVAPAPARASVAANSGDPLAEAMARYFEGGGPGEAPSDRTIIIRKAFHEVQKKQRWRYQWLVGVLVVLLAGLGAYAAFQHHRWNERQAMAQDLFYSMKSLDVQMASVEQMFAESTDPRQVELVRNYRQQRSRAENQYNDFLNRLNVYARGLTEQERILLRITRIFGECELTMPPGYVAEVKNYIKLWQSSDRLQRSLALAKTNGYTVRIADEFLKAGLPPQFFYLAMQESGFDPQAVGPPTRKGIAKGMWQFIPDTGAKYGLSIGPLQDLRRPDPADGRTDWEKSTVAAARYIKDLYSTDAQASALLVMASYNWGEDQVLPLIRSMPANPRERNFWRLLKDHRKELPDETYKYVFYIVSAAVIGENPRLFGFDFDDPLAHLDKP